MHVIETTPAQGGYQRVLALQQLRRPCESVPIFTGPALTLLAEGEENLLVPSSPTLALLRHAKKRKALFPRGLHLNVISDLKSDAVAHASLIFHQHCYNPLIGAWYDRLRTPVFAVVG